MVNVTMFRRVIAPTAVAFPSSALADALVAAAADVPLHGSVARTVASSVDDAARALTADEGRLFPSQAAALVYECFVGAIHGLDTIDTAVALGAVFTAYLDRLTAAGPVPTDVAAA
ncbi:hypothetical protein [Rhodococcus sp. A5(2022)]|uniref:hypothetical protein n=1 Tax=Rhodococcus sp. A5(2022) TaxID=3003588 RepID=UPI0022A83B23|nr:hypothetical protein [Rhodococcus sp. A5(2022)]MCZ1073157.1 hypothetical protein [Rhodococcus sp. A5(2022)]